MTKDQTSDPSVFYQCFLWEAQVSEKLKFYIQHNPSLMNEKLVDINDVFWGILGLKTIMAKSKGKILRAIVP